MARPSNSGYVVYAVATGSAIGGEDPSCYSVVESVSNFRLVEADTDMPGSLFMSADSDLSWSYYYDDI